MYTLHEDRKVGASLVQAGLAVAAILACCGTQAAAAPTVIDFEDLPPQTTVTAQYGPRGVTFPQHFLDAHPAARSGTRVLRSVPPTAEIFVEVPLVMNFTSAQARVKLFAISVGVPLNGRLTAFDAGNNVVAQDGPKQVAVDAFTTMFEVVDPDQTPSIVRAELRLENAAHFAIDDLEFDGQPPAPPPPTPPVVTITTPANGAQLDVTTLDIAGTVTGEGLLSPVKLTMTFARPPEQNVGPFTSELALTGTGTTRQFSLPGFTGVPIGPITITVEAENTGALKGTGTVTVTNLPAPIRNRFTAEGGANALGPFKFGLFLDGCRMAVYERGAISVDGGGVTRLVSGNILTKWLSLRGVLGSDSLGCPLGEERAGPAASRVQDFDGGRIYTNITTGTVYVPSVFVDVIDQQEVEFPDAGMTTVPIVDPISDASQQSQTWLFQQFTRPNRLGLQPATLEIRGTPPMLWVERQFATHQDQTAAIWDSFPCDSNLGPCDVPPPQTVFPPIQNAGDLFCGGEALRGGGNEVEIVAGCIGSNFLNCARREWAPIKGDDYTGTPLFGFVTRSALAGEDFRFSHEWFYNCPGETVRIDCPSDWTVDVVPIGPHRDVEPFQSLFAAGNPSKLELEYEYFYNAVIDSSNPTQPQEGDLLYTVGRWIIDCGHDNFRSELHPIYMFCKMRIVTSIRNPFTGIVDENVFGGRPATRADIWVNGWFPGGEEVIEFDIYPPPRPNPSSRLVVHKPVDFVPPPELAAEGINLEWSLAPAGNANHVHMKFTASLRRNHVTDWGEVKYQTFRSYRGSWFLHWD